MKSIISILQQYIKDNPSVIEEIVDNATKVTAAKQKEIQQKALEQITYT